MSVQALAWGWDQRIGDTATKAVFIAICDWADEKGRCCPGISLLGNVTEQSNRTIIRQIKKLVAAGYISKESRHCSDSTYNTNQYLVNLPGVSYES